MVGGPGPWNDEYFFAESKVWKNKKLRLWIPWQQLVPHSRRRELRPQTDYSYPFLGRVNDLFISDDVLWLGTNKGLTKFLWTKNL